jgi:hypothetical protein
MSLRRCGHVAAADVVLDPHTNTNWCPHVAIGVTRQAMGLPGARSPIHPQSYH